MPGEKHQDRTEIISAALLAIATVASAWCAYQAALWNGDQLGELTAASTAHFEALQENDEASADLILDAETLLHYLGATSRRDTKGADFIREHARDGFRPALEEWLAQRRSGEEPRALPFKSRLYQRSAATAAQALRDKAHTATLAANVASRRSDLFVLHTVFFAMALFFLGTASAARLAGVRRAMMTMGALVLILVVISMVRLPRAPSAPRRAALETTHKAG
jgi:hypothetical protein